MGIVRPIIRVPHNGRKVEGKVHAGAVPSRNGLEGVLHEYGPGGEIRRRLSMLSRLCLSQGKKALGLINVERGANL
jgi:hypothetical protein